MYARLATPLVLACGVVVLGGCGAPRPVPTAAARSAVPTITVLSEWSPARKDVVVQIKGPCPTQEVANAKKQALQGGVIGATLVCFSVPKS